jgi:outer membrane protein OmpA-like peptidoglycan-associated protein
VAAAVSLAPVLAVTATSSASSEESGYLAFSPPAVGSNGVYTVSVAYPTPFTLPALSGTYTAASYSLSAAANTAGCLVNSDGTGFTYQRVGSCTITVTATGDPDDQSNGGNSNGHEGPGNDPDTATGTLTVTVTPGTQTISVTPASGPVGTPLLLVATGYLGSGSITFAVVSGGTAPNCALSGTDKVTSTGAGTCLVTASIAADANYSGAVSAPATMTFTKVSQQISLSPEFGTIGTGLSVVAFGYSGTGAITYAVVSGGTASGCTFGTGGLLTATGPGTCMVTATIAPDSSHLGATSSPTAMTFAKTPLRTLSVTASSETVPQGAAFTETADVSGVLAGDTAHLLTVQFSYSGTGATTYGPSATQPTDPGTYTVTPSHASIAISPSAHAALYSSVYQYHTGLLTITGRVVVTASNGHVTQGTAYNPSASVSGLNAGDSATVSSVTFTYAGVAGTTYGPSTSAPSAAGAYSITPSNAALVVTPSSHQDLYPSPYKYVAGSLIIDPKPITVPVNAPKPPPVRPARTFTIKPFAEGSFALNKKLRAQIERLAVKVKKGHYTHVDLQAFTDNVFTAAFNVVLNENRALAVSRQLTRDLGVLKVRGVTITIVTGVSIVLVSANTTTKGRTANRRVVATLKAN